MKARELDCQLRAFCKWPGSYTSWKTKIIKIIEGRGIEKKSGEAPGTVIQFDKGRYGIVCKDGILEMFIIQIEGRKEVKTQDFINGYKDFIGSNLTSDACQ